MEQRITAPKGCKIESVEHDNNSVVIMFSEDKEQEVRTWDDLIGKKMPNGSRWIGIDGDIQYVCADFEPSDKNAFVDDKHAKSALAMAQISQLMPYYGGAIADEEWKYIYAIRYIICRTASGIISSCYTFNYDFLAFHTAEQRDNFLKYNERLVKDYLMID